MENEIIKRKTVDYRYDGLDWDFLHMMAEMAHLGGQKYDRPTQYADARLVDDRSPVNHIPSHLRDYMMGRPHDHFGDPVYHLVAIANNAMMEAYYHRTHGHIVSALAQPQVLGPEDFAAAVQAREAARF